LVGRRWETNEEAVVAGCVSIGLYSLTQEVCLRQK